MTKSLHIGSLAVRIDIERPATKRAKPWIDKIQIDLHDTGLQIWTETLCGEHFAFDPGRANSFTRHVAELPDLDTIHRYLAEQRVAHRRDLVGAFLAGPVDAMERAIAARDGSSVYFAQVGDQVKIGWSKQVSARLAQLQTGSAMPIRLLGTMPGGLAVERRTHERFAHLRTSGEWFTAAPELLAYIAEVSS